MSKIEKTLELNITHEILSLADSFWWFLQPISLKRYWRPHWRFPFMQTPKSFATGLHINLEGKVGGGYDVCIHSPSNFQGGNARLLFMQFKAGVEMPFNDNTSSIFYGDITNQNIHVEFTINNNTKNDQHKLLTDLAKSAGNKDAVVYVFPRIVDQSQLEQNIGKLLNKTSFISITDIDNKAAANGININDNKPHKFRTSYDDFNKNEINFDIFSFGKPENPGGILGEIFAVRMYRALQTLREVQIEGYLISKYHIVDAIIRHILNMGMYFAIPYQNAVSIFKEFPELNKRLNYLAEYDDLPRVYSIDRVSNEYIAEIFNNILTPLNTYFQWIEKIEYFVKMIEIPPPPSKYSIEMLDKELRFSLEIQNENILSDSLEEITYTLF